MADAADGREESGSIEHGGRSLAVQRRENRGFPAWLRDERRIDLGKPHN